MVVCSQNQILLRLVSHLRPNFSFQHINDGYAWVRMRRRTLARSIRDFHSGYGPILQVKIRQIVPEHHLVAALCLCRGGTARAALDDAVGLPFLRISYWRSTRFTCAKSSATFRMSFGFSTAGCGYGQTRSHAVNQRAVPKRQTESRSRVPRVFTPKRQHPGRRCKLSPCARARIMGIFRGFDGAC